MGRPVSAHLLPHVAASRRSGGIHLWVSGDAFPDFSRLYCDLVFVVGEKLCWPQPNHIEPADQLVDSAEAFNDHYRWHTQHPYRRRRHRYTLKADPERSFQAQAAGGDLLDIVPSLERQGVMLTSLRAGFASRPMKIPSRIAAAVAADLRSQATHHLTGPMLRRVRIGHPELASP